MISIGHFIPNAEENTFFSSAHGTFLRIDHISGHKSNLSKFKKIEIVSSIFSDHDVLRLDINYQKKTVRNTNTWRLNNTFLNTQQVTEEIKREIKRQRTYDNSKTMGMLNPDYSPSETLQFSSVQFSLVRLFVTP